MRQNRQYLFNMSYLKVFGVLTGVGVDVSKFFGVGAVVLKRGTGAESESEKSDSTHLWLVDGTRFIGVLMMYFFKKFRVWDLRLECMFKLRFRVYL